MIEQIDGEDQDCYWHGDCRKYPHQLRDLEVLSPTVIHAIIEEDHAEYCLFSVSLCIWDLWSKLTAIKVPGKNSIPIHAILVVTVAIPKLVSLKMKLMMSFVRCPKLDTQRCRRWFRARRNWKDSIADFACLMPASSSFPAVSIRKLSRSSRSPRSSNNMFHVRESSWRFWTLPTVLMSRRSGGSMSMLPFRSC